MKIIIEGRELEVDDAIITKAIEDKTDVKVEAKDLVIRTKAEDETFVTNLTASAKTAAVEMAVKEARNTLGLDFQGKKIENLVDAVKTKALADANIEPEKQVKELKNDLETLKGTLTTLTNEKEQLQQQFHSFKSDAIVNNTLAAAIPENALLPKDDMILLIKSKMKFTLDESNRVVVTGADGNIMKDSVLNPVDPKTVVTQFFNDNPSYMKSPGGGAGGQDTPGGNGKMTVEKFIEKKAAEGISHTDERFQAELQELIKKGEIEG